MRVEIWEGADAGALWHSPGGWTGRWRVCGIVMDCGRALTATDNLITGGEGCAERVFWVLVGGP